MSRYCVCADSVGTLARARMFGFGHGSDRFNRGCARSSWPRVGTDPRRGSWRVAWADFAGGIHSLRLTAIVTACAGAQTPPIAPVPSIVERVGLSSPCITPSPLQFFDQQRGRAASKSRACLAQFLRAPTMLALAHPTGRAKKLSLARHFDPSTSRDPPRSPIPHSPLPIPSARPHSAHAPRLLRTLVRLTGSPFAPFH